MGQRPGRVRPQAYNHRSGLRGCSGRVGGVRVDAPSSRRKIIITDQLSRPVQYAPPGPVVRGSQRESRRAASAGQVMTEPLPALHLVDLLTEPTKVLDAMPLVPGDVVHFYAHLSFAMTEHLPLTVRPGSTIELTSKMIELSHDRNGWSWLSLVDDLDEQQRRYGRVRFARGPAPDALLPERDSPDWDIASEEAHAAARAIEHPGKRQEAMSKAAVTFGPAGPQSQTQATYAQFR